MTYPQFITRLSLGKRFVFVLSLLALAELCYPQAVVAVNQDGPRHQEPIYSPTVRICDARLPDIPNRPVRAAFYATVTAYSSSVDETDSDPFTTAAGTRTRAGVVAYNHLPFGTKVRLPEIFGDQAFVIEDRLRPGASRYHFDIWLPSKAEAKQWGAKVVKIEIF